ncbi:prepilin-type N-terminal cleavage/methylation domain-containing protein [Patescibacteria group bacterium]
MSVKQAGQTLIESLVALTILTVGLMGAVSLGIYTIRAADASQRDIIAMNLAQEGIEGIRWIRDSNWKQGKNWGEGISKGLPGVNYRGRIEVNLPTDSLAYELVEAGSVPMGPAFYDICYDETTGRYLHAPSGAQSCEVAGYKDSGMTRRLLTRGASDHDIMVLSAVMKDGQVYRLYEQIYDWW